MGSSSVTRADRDDIRTRLDHNLTAALSRLRQLGGAVGGEELPGVIGDNSPFADEVDEIQATETREIGLATREMLVERVNRLSDAVDRLNDGEYGVCVECAEPISPARLHAVPEVQTCVRCQDGIERLGRQLDRSSHASRPKAADGSHLEESAA